VRAALASANANSPKGAIEEGGRHYQLYTNDQANHAADYRPLVVAYRNGGAVRLSDVADVQDSVEDVRNEGLANGNPSVLAILYRQPGANIIDTVDRVKAELPHLQAAMPTDVDITQAIDRTTTLRASLRDTELTLLLAVGLVTVVVFLFLGDIRSTLIPSVAVPISILGTFGAMHLLHYSLDNFSLMALTISTGFVVDDAVVVLENITRYTEAGLSRTQAALRGAREVGFTVLSISVSLIAVFVPVLLMGGILGRLFRDRGIPRHLPDHYPDDVLAVAAAPTGARPTPAVRPTAGGLRAQPYLGTPAQRANHAGTVCDNEPERVAVYRDPERLLSAAGYRAVGRQHPGGSKHLLSIDAPQAWANDVHRPKR